MLPRNSSNSDFEGSGFACRSDLHSAISFCGILFGSPALSKRASFLRMRSKRDFKSALLRGFKKDTKLSVLTPSTSNCFGLTGCWFFSASSTICSALNSSPVDFTTDAKFIRAWPGSNSSNSSTVGMTIFNPNAAM